MDVYEVAEEYLGRGETGARATIVKKLGAAPREEGAKMFVGGDGKFFGTVGGGCMEADVWQAAMKVVKTGEPRMLHFRMDGKQVEDEGMICGGNIDVFIEPATGKYKGLYTRIKDLEKAGSKAFVVTRFSETSLEKSILLEDGTVLGDPLDEEAKAAITAHPDMRKPAVSNSVIIEPVLSSAFLYIFGAGHVSQFVSRIAATVDFRVVVIDDRADFANTERFPEAETVIAEDFNKVLETLPFYGNEYVVILTRGHKHDALVLGEVLKKPAHYIGMIGSRRKTKMVYEYLKSQGYDEKLFQQVHAPIGIDIYSETPQEIAVSIVAELIKVRRQPAKP
jgi:xanthine dehydrogenase accessory factor